MYNLKSTLFNLRISKISFLCFLIGNGCIQLSNYLLNSNNGNDKLIQQIILCIGDIFYLMGFVYSKQETLESNMNTIEAFEPQNLPPTIPNMPMPNNTPFLPMFQLPPLNHLERVLHNDVFVDMSAIQGENGNVNPNFKF